MNIRMGIVLVCLVGAALSGCKSQPQSWQSQFANAGPVAGTGMTPSRSLASYDVPMPDGFDHVASSATTRFESAGGFMSGSGVARNEYRGKTSVPEFLVYFREVAAMRGWKEIIRKETPDIQELAFTRDDGSLTVKIDASKMGFVRVASECTFNFHDVKQ